MYYLSEFYSSFGWMAHHTPWHRLSIKVDDVGQTSGTEKKTGNAYIFCMVIPRKEIIF